MVRTGIFRQIASNTFLTFSLLQADTAADVLLGFDRLEQAGTKAKFDFSFPHFDQDYYLGIYSYDTSGNRGRISNLVHIRIPSPPGRPSSQAKDVMDLMNRDQDRGEPDWIMIGAIAGVIGMLLLLGIVIIIYYFVVARKAHKANRNHENHHNHKSGSASSVILTSGNGGGTSSGSDETDSSSFDSDIKNIMAANPLGPSLQSVLQSQSSSVSHHNSVGVGHHGATQQHQRRVYKPNMPASQQAAPMHQGSSQGSTPSDSQVLVTIT